ncbi:MAG: hypothetical protein OIF36_03860 [Alphaproteobacteria bacterium]|nr:hypothetical protein [Alphaproteobacteria bacterium]
MAKSLNKSNKYNRLTASSNKDFAVVFNWLSDKLNSNGEIMFITIKPHYVTKDRISMAKEADNILKRFFRSLMGRHWQKRFARKEVDIFGVIEQGKTGALHFHILFNAVDYSYQQIVTVFRGVSRYIKCDIGTKKYGQFKARFDNRNYNKDIVVSKVYNKEGAIEYCMKELGIYGEKIRSENIMTFSDLFS